MAILGVLVLVALLIPIVAVLVDSPIGRAFARRVEGPSAVPPQMVDLARKVEALESEVDDLSRAVDGLREENQFLQKLLEDPARRPELPPRTDR